MGGPAFWGIAGSPVSHSLTPRLFSIVASSLGIGQAEGVFIEATSIDEFESQVSALEGDLWLSCTAPLKHSPQSRLGVSGPDGVNAINQLKRSGGGWSGTSTDGRGFVSACRHIGMEPSGSILRMRGGGSAARSIAAAWSSEGGMIIPVLGRRGLVSGPWDGSLTESGQADIAVDLDAAPAGGDSIELQAELQVSISYGSGASSDEFAVIMVAAQHLEAWRSIYAPQREDGLPGLGEVLSKL
jgi:shikimate 5-dehydrogenase